MIPSALNQPVANFVKPVPFLTEESSLERAAAMLRQIPSALIPVQSGSTLIGVVTEKTLAEALGKGHEPSEDVRRVISVNFQTIRAHETAAEALRRISESPDGCLLVLDHGSRVLGVVSASDLYARQQPSVRPPLVGGMATPFGVYLTNGALGAGVSGWALIATGGLMFALVALGALAEIPLAHWAVSFGYGRQIRDVKDLFPMVVLFVGMRLLPLSGIHAAEHKVVHAIERGEALVPEVVARMPRVHPRCGTNLFAGATIFLAILGWSAIPDEGLRLLAAALATFLLWRPLGNATQWLLTTKPPNRRQIEMGIKSGEDLLEKYKFNRNSAPNPVQRIWNSGMPHVLLGFFGCQLILWGLSLLFGFNVPFL